MAIIQFPGSKRRTAPRSARTLPDKLQLLVLTRPVAAKEVEKLLDRLLPPHLKTRSK